MPQAKSNIKVLHVSASSMSGGGPEHLWQLLRHLPEKVQNYVAAPTCAPYGQRFAEAVGQERLCPLPQRRFSFFALLKMLAFVRQHDIDIIHSHGKGAGVYARPVALFTGTASVHTFHGLHLPSSALPRQLYLALERTLCTVSKACIAVSQGEADQAQNLGLGTGKITVIPNGVEVPESLPARNRPSPFTLVHVSRFDPRQKNSLWLLELALGLRAAGRLEQCRFVLVGNGEQRAELEQRVHEASLGKFFHFAGQQPSARPFFREGGCLISTSRWEGLPLAVLEAQAEGLPAVVSNVVGNRDAVEDGATGFYYPLNHVQEAVACVSRLMDEENLWKRMRMAAHARAQQNFSVEGMAEKTAEIYATLSPTKE